MGHDQTTNEKSDNGDKGGQLQVAQPRDGVARGTSTGIPRAKADQKTAQDQNGKPFRLSTEDHP